MMDTRLEQAISTLRAIRRRYEAESDAVSGRRRSYTVQVALGYADMLWIAAAIDAAAERRVLDDDRVVTEAVGQADEVVDALPTARGEFGAYRLPALFGRRQRADAGIGQAEGFLPFRQELGRRAWEDFADEPI